MSFGPVSRAVISRLDQGLNELVGEMDARDDVLLAVTADHATPSGSVLIHSGEPVPMTMVGPNVRRDDVTSFDEINAAAGGLGHLRGDELMRMMLNYANCSVLIGHRLGDRERPHVPKYYPVFQMT